MKVLFDHPNPFYLAHGGFQTQIEQTKEALQKMGVEVEYLRWWDAAQSGAVIHFFGRPPASYVEFAHSKGVRVVMTELLGGLAARSASARFIQHIFILSSRTFLPTSFTAKLAWDSYKLADAVVALTSYEAGLMKEMFGASPERVHTVPNGVEDVFLNAEPCDRGQWLVCTATIAERKRVLETAEAAIKAGTPLWIIGKAYSDADHYAQRFFELAKRNPETIRYEGAIEDRHVLADAYRQARGFVLLSSMESLSLSALEAAGCGCPLLLSDLPWARTVFNASASYCPIGSVSRTAKVLREFYDSAPEAKPAHKPVSWLDVAQQLKAIYEGVLRTSR